MLDLNDIKNINVAQNFKTFKPQNLQNKPPVSQTFRTLKPQPHNLK